MLETLLVISAGFLGGALNAIAGGGSFITLPALILIGINPISANATGTVALLPGYLASAWRYRRDLEFPDGLSFSSTIFLSLIGGSLGAALLLCTNEKIFEKLIPWLLLIATLLFMYGSKIVSPSTKSKQFKTSVFVIFLLTAACIYGGYFNGGLGIILLAILSLMQLSNFQSMNGLKSVISAVITSIASLIYFSGDVVSYSNLFELCVSAIIGGHFGASISYKLTQRAIRITITLVGAVMTLLFFLVPLLR